MKKITELTEQEIYNLKDSEIESMIKMAKLEAGVKLVSRPKEPTYFDIPAKDKTIYKADGFEQEFEDIKELNTVLDAIRATKTGCISEYESSVGYDVKYMISGIGKSWNRNTWDNVTSMAVYSKELFNEVRELLKNNKKLKEQYESELAEYNQYIDENGYIESEIYDRVREVREKFYKLQSLSHKFKFDYMTVTDSEEIALAFMDKAYSLTDEQKEYILKNYKNI